MTFQVPRPVFTLTIRLIDRLAVDAGTRRASALVVRVDVIDVHDQAGICYIHGKRGIEMVLSGDPMQPDACIPGTNLTMDRLALGGSMHSPRNEPKCVNQEIVCGWDVLTGEHRDDSFERWHERLHLRPDQQ